MSLVNKTIREIVQTFGSDNEDTGSAEVQVVLLKARVARISYHLVHGHRKDKSSLRGMRILLNKARRLESYMAGEKGRAEAFQTKLAAFGA